MTQTNEGYLEENTESNLDRETCCTVDIVCHQVELVEEQYTRQPRTADGTVLFGMKMTKSNNEDALSKRETVKTRIHERRSIDSCNVNKQAMCRDFSSLYQKADFDPSASEIALQRCVFETPDRSEILGVDPEIDSSRHQTL